MACAPPSKSGASGAEKTPGIQAGDVVWAKVHKKGQCWPGLIIDGADCGQEISSLKKVWVYWFGDHRVTEVQKSHVYDFKNEFQRFFKKKVGKGYDAGVFEALKECAKRLGKIKSGLTRENLVDWAFKEFPESPEIFETLENRKVLFKTNGNGAIPTNVRQQLQKFCQSTEDRIDAESISSVESSLDDADSPKLAIVEAIYRKEIQLTDLCLACFTVKDDLVDHPLFNAFICSNCLTLLKNFLYAVGTDGNNYNCAVCLGVEPALIYMCSQPDCFRSFCQNCLRVVFRISTKEIKRLEDWCCFMCTPYSEKTHGFVQPLDKNWRLNVWELFHKSDLERTALRTHPVRILFTGGSTRSVRLAIERLSKVKIEVSTIFISGFFEKDVVSLSETFPEKINSVPAPWDLDDVSLMKYFPIDIVIGGSRELYSADPGDQKSMNAVCVFDDFHRIISNIHGSNVVLPPFWMFEFEEPICRELYGIISRFLDFEPGRWQTSSEVPVPILVWTNMNALWTLLEANGVPQK